MNNDEIKIFNTICLLDLHANTAFVTLIRMFSQENVYAITTTITGIPSDLAYSGNQVDRPFFVIIIRSEEDLQAFANVTRIVNMNLHQTALIFAKNVDFCRNPVGNPLNLVFDSKVIVKCQGIPIVYE